MSSPGANVSIVDTSDKAPPDNLGSWEKEGEGIEYNLMAVDHNWMNRSFMTIDIKKINLICELV